MMLIFSHLWVKIISKLTETHEFIMILPVQYKIQIKTLFINTIKINFLIIITFKMKFKISDGSSFYLMAQNKISHFAPHLNT